MKLKSYNPKDVQITITDCTGKEHAITAPKSIFKYSTKRTRSKNKIHTGTIECTIRVSKIRIFKLKCRVFKIYLVSYIKYKLGKFEAFLDKYFVNFVKFELAFISICTILVLVMSSTGLLGD